MLPRTLFAGLVAALLLSLPASPAYAYGAYAAGAAGADISWPQCGRAVDITASTFGLVGINGGRPFTMNPCFGQQYGWASAGGATPGVYVNLAGGQSPVGYQTCSEGDDVCAAYNFGYNAAEYTFSQAYFQSGGSSFGANTWWLDVETANQWSDRQELNAAVVRGAVDYLQRNAGRQVGIYSTARQYAEITGGQYSPGGVANWVAGADGLGDTGKCGSGFWPGAQVWFFQFENFDMDLDQDVAC